MSAIIHDNDPDNVQIPEALALLKNMSKDDIDLIAKLAAEQKRRKFLLMVKMILIAIIIVSSFLILRYDVVQRVFTPKEYWTEEVQKLELSVKLLEITLNTQQNDQDAWQKNYNSEFEKMVDGLLSTGMNREEAMKTAKDVMQSAAQSVQDLSYNERSILTQFKNDLEIARQKLDKYERHE